MKKLLLIFCISIFFPLSCAAGSFYQPTYHFGFNYPDSWQASANHYSYRFLTLHSTFSYLENTYNSTIYFSLQIDDARTFIATTAANNPQLLLDYMTEDVLTTTNNSCEITQATIQTLNGIDCFIVKYNYIIEENEQLEHKQEQIVYLVHNGLVHRLFFTTVDADYFFVSDWQQILARYTQGLANA